jgi:tRNA (guanine-N7-)-methyltransferase
VPTGRLAELTLTGMGHKKLIRFAELNDMKNVFQFPDNAAGKWGDVFGNDNPVILELACGKGEYAIGLGRMYPDRNFIGVDLKGNRIWVGAKKATESKLHNVAFLRIQIDQIPAYFSKNEIDEIWITFPDPQLRTSKSKKRLTHPKFLRLYTGFLKPGGIIHLKTDSPDLYNFTRLVIDMYHCELIEDIDNLYSQESLKEELKIKTYYESLDIAQSNKVHYLAFSLPPELPGREKDEELKQLIKENAGTERR